MGLSPSQGHNNLRLYHTTPYHHNHRLDDTKHNFHILHKKLQIYPKSQFSRINSVDHKRFKYYAERPSQLFELCDVLHKSEPNIKMRHSSNNIFQSNERYLRKSFPLLSNLPFINRDASIVLVNNSPFGLRDPRFGIFHHCSQSVSYF